MSPDNSWAQFASYTGQRSEPVQQSIDQSSSVSFVVSWRSTSMHHHASRLIYDREIIVFVNNVQRNLFRDGPQGRTFNLTDNLNAFSSA